MTPDVSPADVARQAWVRVFRASLRGLRALYHPASGLMARHGVRTASGWELHAPSPRNTAMALGALYRLEGLGIAHGLDTRALEQRLDGLSGEMSVPDTCLDLWSDAMGGGRRAEGIWARLRPRLVAGALEALELAWALAALSHHLPVASRRDEVSVAAASLAARLLAHQHPGTGLFRASLRRHGLLRRQKSDATLASQVYPVYALARFGEAFDRRDALDAARRCAETLIALQGPLGQWWWKYDVESGKVTGGYPVYPVNQDAAVPSRSCRWRVTGGPTGISRRWPGGWPGSAARTKRGVPLIDDDAGCIARSLEPNGDGWRVSWDWFSYHPARAVVALTEVGEAAGLRGAELKAAVRAEDGGHGA